MSEAASTRGGLLNGAASIIGTGLAFAMTFVITNEWGVESTGVFFGVAKVFSSPATLWTSFGFDLAWPTSMAW